MSDQITKFRAGDTVRHNPSGEEWILANDEEDGGVSPCGWPDLMADAKDCTLISAADDEARLSMLFNWARPDSRGDHRHRAAKSQLAAIRAAMGQPASKPRFARTSQSASRRALRNTVLPSRTIRFRSTIGCGTPTKRR